MKQRITFKNSRNLNLVGTLWTAASDKIIIMTHGSGSNRFARGMFEPIAHALQRENYNVLAFDFSGHGESDDDIVTLEKTVNDVSSAIAYVKQQGFKNIALFGHSLGAYPCLRNGDDKDIKTMVFIGGLTGPINQSWNEFCSEDQINAMKKTGYISADVNDGLRKTVKIDGKFIDTLRTIDQQKLLQHVGCPVLIIHGDIGKQELDLLAASEKGIKYLPKNSQLKIIKNADHSFSNHINEIIELAIAWYKKYI